MATQTNGDSVDSTEQSVSQVAGASQLPTGHDATFKLVRQGRKKGSKPGKKSKAVPSHPVASTRAAPTSTPTNVLPQPKISKEETLEPTVKVDQKLDNLLEMIRPQRCKLFAGPKVTIHIGSSAITGISKRLAMAVSKLLNIHFTRYPESADYHFKQDSIAPAAVQYLLIAWPQDMSKSFEAYAVPMLDAFSKNVAILRASRTLGMESYTKHILTYYTNYLKTSLPSYEEIGVVEKNAASSKDPLFTSMVNHLCHSRHKGLIPDPEHFAEYLKKHERLRCAMESTDKYFVEKGKKQWEATQAKRQAKEAENRAKWQAREEEKRVKWEAREEEKRIKYEENKIKNRERMEKEKKAKASVKEKIAKNGSGLLMVTAEEAELLRRR